MDKLHNLKDRICDFDNLMEAYHEAAKGKRYRDEVIAFSLNLSDNIHSIQDDLLNQTYVVGPYREFYVRYPKPRLVMALGFRDRIVQWAIYRQINPFLDSRYIEDSYGCRVGKGTLAAANRALYYAQAISRKPDASDWYVIKGDFAKYFYRVDHDKTIDFYAGITDDAWFIWLISVIINNPDVPFGLPRGARADDCPRDARLFNVGVPIGNLTSQETGNLYLDPLDQFVKHVLKVHFYARYMDDFVLYIKGKKNAECAFERITDFSRDELLLDMSPKCTIQKATAPLEFVGYLITPHGLRLRKKTTRHIKRSLLHLLDEYNHFRLSADKLMESVVCYKGMCKNCNGRNLVVWINEHILYHMEDRNMKASYKIVPNGDGTLNLYLTPDDCPTRVLRGIVPPENLVTDVRERFSDYYVSAEEIPTDNPLLYINQRQEDRL